MTRREGGREGGKKEGIEMNIPIKDTGTKNCLRNAKLYFWPEGCQPACEQNQHKEGWAGHSPLYT
jgi:hypothetical protein